MNIWSGQFYCGVQITLPNPPKNSLWYFRLAGRIYNSRRLWIGVIANLKSGPIRDVVSYRIHTIFWFYYRFVMAIAMLSTWIFLNRWTTYLSHSMHLYWNAPSNEHCPEKLKRQSPWKRTPPLKYNSLKLYIFFYSI